MSWHLDEPLNKRKSSMLKNLFLKAEYQFWGLDPVIFDRCLVTQTVTESSNRKMHCLNRLALMFMRVRVYRRVSGLCWANHRNLNSFTLVKSGWMKSPSRPGIPKESAAHCSLIEIDAVTLTPLFEMDDHMIRAASEVSVNCLPYLLLSSLPWSLWNGTDTFFPKPIAERR